MIRKLSARAWQILLVIDERTSSSDGSGRFWYPGDLRGTSDWCDRLQDYVNINGGSDARIIDSLTTKGLVRRHPNCHRYSASITEEGRLLIEQALEQGKIPLVLAKDPSHAPQG